MSSPALAARKSTFDHRKPAPPGYSGPDSPKLVVVGEHFESESRPFTSKSGVIFGEAMLEAGIDPAKAGFCWAGKGLVEQLMELRPGWVVLSGDVALQQIRPDLATAGMHGRPFSLLPMSDRGPRDARLGGTVAFSTLSHVALRRKRKELHPIVTSELRALKRIARDPAGWMNHVPDVCCKCELEFHRIDDQGVVYCEYHWDWPTDPLEQIARAFHNPDCEPPATGDGP